MPLNKLDNFIKNTEGRILYVNPSDIDATDTVDNQGNSLARPFKTIQRALIEAARFSYVRGNNNDLIEKTTILLFPGEHVIDNRPGWAIKDTNGVATAVSPTGIETPAISSLSLDLDTNFDITQQDNILYKFNSVYGGTIIPRGVSLVGLDLRKTKIRPKYIPNPTDNTPQSCVFRLTGTCYIWQLSFFDGDESGTVYTNNQNYTENFKSIPLFSHHKLTCFEYADGLNDVLSYGLTDLDMYYSKLSNAFNVYRAIVDVDKYPENSDGFSKRTPEWEIVGAFASDPVDIFSIISGNGITPSNRITVTTRTPHNLNSGTPIKIRGVSSSFYNISTKVQEVINSTTFTYLLPSFPINLPASPSSSSASVIVETDTVTGASPYIFNCSLRSVWGMNGILADGSKASGFKSMVTAQFTGVSLQKDDRAFVKYNPVTRSYEGVLVSPVYGAELPLGASQTNPSRTYHLDPDAIYRRGWESSHIKIRNDAFIQVVSVFAIGFNKHFDAETGGDFSITNSNSNFGQIALSSSGFKKEAFQKDNKGYVTSIVPPRAIDTTVEENISWLTIDVGLTTSVGISSHLYLYGYENQTVQAPINVQGYKVGARNNDALHLNILGNTYTANILMDDMISSSKKEYTVTSGPSSNIFTIGNHNLLTGEKIIIRSDSGDLPEGLSSKSTYYAIRHSSTQIKIASTLRNAQIGEEDTVYGGQNLKIISRVSDKVSGEIGCPIQYDTTNQNWFITVNTGNTIYSTLNSVGGVATLGEFTGLSYIKRISDERSIDEKLYRLRVVIPKEATNSKNPEAGFIIQESSSTSLRNDGDFTITDITASDHDYKRNPRFISTCTVSSNVVTVIAERPHLLNVGDEVVIKNVQSTTNNIGQENLGYNGVFTVLSIPNDLQFTYSTTDVDNVPHDVGNCINNTSSRSIDSLGRFERRNNKSNVYIYRNEIGSDYIQGVQDGVYYIYALNASNSIPVEFTSTEYSQNPVDLYPQLDRDNVDDNPPPSATYAKRAPLGDVETNDVKKSITRETTNKFLTSMGYGLNINSVSSTSTSASITFDRPHGFGRILSGTITPGSGYNNGTYYNVRLLNGSQIGTWNGALATVTVSGGAVTSANITNGGSGYAGTESLFFDQTRIGIGNGLARFNLSTNSINRNIGDVIQFTGSGSVNDTYHRITNINSSTQVSVAKTTGDTTIVPEQYAFVVGPSIQITSTSYNSTNGVLTVNCSSSHGLVVGNKFKIINSTNNNLGDYLVRSVNSVTSFTAQTGKSLSANNGYVLKHGLSSNNSALDFNEENFSSRNVVIYGRELLNLTSSVTNSNSSLSITTLSGISTSQRFQLGDYVQVDNEIMRIISSTNNTSINVVRGALGTRPESHVQNSLIKKIIPIPVEFRRPSILRASGHTFEYLGYGPGNYSTALPQVQVKTLTDRESFLSQAQERSCGVVVYNGINNGGDVFSGNTKTLASSGEIISFDIPQPTITGQDTSSNTAVFDEITIKQKLLVEGGNTGTILSQFDGPVTFNNDLRIKGDLSIEGNVNITSITQTPVSVNSDTIITGTLTVDNSSTFKGEVTVDTGIVPDTDEGAYIGTVSKPFSEAHVGEIRIAVTDDNTIDTATGSLKLSTPTGSNVAISTDVTVNGTLTTDYLVAPNVSPIGSIVMWAGNTSSIPSDWRRCNGITLNTYTFRLLHQVLSNTYGGTAYQAGVTDQPGATTTFQLPNLDDRFVVGVGPAYSLNGTGGSSTVALQIANLPPHNHPGSSMGNSPEHSHTVPSSGGHAHGALQPDGQRTISGQAPHGHGGSVGTGNAPHNHPYNRGADRFRGAPGQQANAQVSNYPWDLVSTGSDNAPHSHPLNINDANAPHTHVVPTAGSSHSHTIDNGGEHTHPLTISTEGQGTAHENLPPYRALYYIIRVR
jgi:microcystin-dependent protein